MRLGKFELKWNNFVLDLMLSLVLALNSSQEIVIEDVKNGKPRQIVERKKYLQVDNLLNKLVNTITITKYIINEKVNLTNGKLLVLVLAIKIQLTKAITEDKI